MEALGSHVNPVPFYRDRAGRSLRGCGAALLCLALTLWAAVADLAAQKAPPARPAAPRDLLVPQLVDITEAAGIRFRHLSAPEKKYIVESMSGGVVLIDYDRDGWPDIYFTNAATVDMVLAGKKARSALYRNNHDLTFTDVTDQAGVGFPCDLAMGGAVGDYNNDGWPDLYVTCLGANVLYRNNGDGTFTDVTKAAGVGDTRWSTGAAFGDYDADGWLDLFVSNYVDFHLDDLPKFGSSPTCQYRGLLVQCGPRGLKGAGDTLYHNNKDGTFTDVSETAGVSDKKGFYGLGVVWSDLDNDGRIDLFVANDGVPNFLYRNDGNGHFTEMAFQAGAAVSDDGRAQAGMGIAVGDLVGDGRFSLFVTDFSEEYNILFRNQGNMSFTDASFAAGVAAGSLPYVGWGTGFFDLDNDGRLDLLAVNGHVYPQVDTLDVGTKYRQPKLLYLNKGNGAFADVSQLAGPALRVPRVSRGAAFGDLDNDGDIDVVVEDIDGPPLILRNDGGNRKRWVGFELAGAKSNRLGIGARLKITAGGVTQTGEVRSGGSYLSQNDLRIHFGLADSTTIDILEVRWPSGVVDVVKNLSANKYYALLEGKGVVSPEQIRPASKAH